MSMLMNSYWAKDERGEWRPIYTTDYTEPLSFWNRLRLMWVYKSRIRSSVHYGRGYISWIKQNTPFQKYLLEK